VIDHVLPRTVQACEAFSDRPEVVLFPEEAAVIARAVEKRRREFTTVRGCARDALAAIGVAPAAIVPGTRGEPIWPAGVVGSMTHCPGYRAAVVAREHDFRAIGIDAEVDQPLPAALVDQILLPAERQRITELREWGVSVDRLVFCAKEAVYKTWYPLTHRFLDFHEASVTPDARGTFTAELRLDDPPESPAWPTAFAGRWLAANGLLITATSIRFDR
jgi:4'-phosphopantetheinyl transferase EntD